ncbi:hypothetical protein SKAU_G00201380 [Synaphobranchus kaupii]|uniref:UMP-CMP kinase n=1 Tax=Synaphobranchus kaupii TaxID=118154 RepID=A0A9Q1FFJ9_SYNKA|nr:hypothetical protein SKAU_G00201380 [Synaphobranchus kaupii]
MLETDVTSRYTSLVTRSNRSFNPLFPTLRRDRLTDIVFNNFFQCMLFRILSTLSKKVPKSVYRVPLAMKPQVVFVLGGPGAGKGTQCAKIVENYSYTHLSAGDLLRAERGREGSESGQLIDSYIKEGKIVPVEITINLLRKAMEETMKQDKEKFRFLIDGFPRNQDNLQGWTTVMDSKADVKFVLFFDCCNQVCIDRCLERGKDSGRTDDNKESLQKRIQTYLQSTRPIIELYEKQGKVRTVDASRDVDEVFADVKGILDKEGETFEHLPVCGGRGGGGEGPRARSRGRRAAPPHWGQSWEREPPCRRLAASAFNPLWLKSLFRPLWRFIQG